jgi:cellulose synthase/poly-beta-1,6-N-acetylglucosamine synthase-like glycosyltransferase
MTVFLLILVLYSIVCLQIILLLTQDRNFESKESSNLPKISVLIAVRNEENNLPKLFKSLEKLTYPKEKLEIIFGNDQSTDNSRDLIEKFCSEKEYCQLIDIQPTDKQIAKANVLMQICNIATGDFFYFLDADMEPNPNILQNYLSYFDAQKAGITGITLPIGETLFAKMQQIDWILALSMLAKAEKIGFDTTAMGNNMFLSKEEYQKTGGYGELEKSSVEDYILYKAVLKNGKKFPLIFDAKLMSFTQPIESFGKLLMQRKRWMSGVYKVDWGLKVLLFLQGIFYPIALVSLFFVFTPVLALMFCKMILQFFFVSKSYQKLDLKVSFLEMVLYEVYNFVLTNILIVFSALPIKFDWKGRRF